MTRAGLQTGNPLYIQEIGASAIELAPVMQTENGLAIHDEAFVRDLIFSNPDILPIGEIEPAFIRAKSICIELPNASGFIDNLLVTPEGGIVLVECKLQRNPQARREVIAQILDYAAQLAAWDFEALDKAILQAQTPHKAKPISLLEHFKSEADFDEISFIDSVTRNLRLGRMLLLIVGDGIREGLESMTALLQMHPGFHATLALIEIRLFKAPQGGYFVQPRTLMKTLNIERGIVRLTSDQLSIVHPEPSVAKQSNSSPSRPSSLTEELFFEELSKKATFDTSSLKTALECFEQIGISPEYKQSLILRWYSPDGQSHNLATIYKNGVLWFDNILSRLKTETQKNIATKYLRELAALVGGEVKQVGSTTSVSIYHQDKPLPVQQLIQHNADWVRITSNFINDLKATMV